MNRKLTALSLAVVTAVTLSGCASGTKASSDSTAAAPAATSSQAQGNGRNGQFAQDPELQQIMQEQQQDQKQIDDLIVQIDKDAGLPAPAAPDQQQAPPNGQGNGGGQRQGNRQGGNGGSQGNGGTQQQSKGAQQPDMQAVKTAMGQEHQAATDLVAKLTTFDGLVKQAANNQKALKDAQTLFQPIETSLESIRGGRGFFGGNRGSNGNGNGGTTDNSANANGGNNGGNGNPGGGRNMTQGVQGRIDLIQAAASKLDAAITQLKSDLGQ